VVVIEDFCDLPVDVVQGLSAANNVGCVHRLTEISCDDVFRNELEERGLGVLQPRLVEAFRKRDVLLRHRPAVSRETCRFPCKAT
jgi:hypothetical protein